MAVKPTKVRYSGVGVFANGYLLSRVQNVSIDTDLGEEEARELTNPEVVEYTANNPQVTVSIETNEYGSVRNIRAMAQITGGAATDIVNVNSFDGTSADITVQVEEDNTLTRSVVVNDAFLTSISWNYDVGGVATETFNLEADNKTWYMSDYAQSWSLMGFDPEYSGGGQGYCKIPIDIGTGFQDYRIPAVYIDGVVVTGDSYVEDNGFSYENSTNWTKIGFVDSQFTTTGARYRVVLAASGASKSTTIAQATSTSTIGSITRGKLNVYLVSGGDPAQITGYGYGQTNSTTNLLRVQSASIDADLSREILNELGHFRAFDRSLTLPVPVNITFSSLASDLEDWAKFANLANPGDDATNKDMNITEFVKTAAFKVEIYDKQDTDSTRVLLKSLTITGLQVVSESMGVDVGGNATQDITARASNFTVSGTGIPGQHPLSATPST